jgi:hypothetical protein
MDLREGDRFADPDELLVIVARLAVRYADLLDRLSDYDGTVVATGTSRVAPS